MYLLLQQEHRVREKQTNKKTTNFGIKFTLFHKVDAYVTAVYLGVLHPCVLTQLDEVGLL